MGLSPESFELAKAVTPKISAAVSMLGSTLIVRDIYRKYKRRRGLSTTNQVILSMSLADIGSSFWAHLLSTWMVPRGSEGATLTAGNMATCSVSNASASAHSMYVFRGSLKTKMTQLTLHPSFIFVNDRRRHSSTSFSCTRGRGALRFSPSHTGSSSVERNGNRR